MTEQKNIYINTWDIAHSKTSLVGFILMDLILNKKKEQAQMSNHPQEFEKIDSLQQTLRSIRRQSGRINAALFAELMTILGMLIVNLTNQEMYHQLALYVYPAMMVTVAGIGIGKDKLQKRQQWFLQEYKSLEM